MMKRVFIILLILISYHIKAQSFKEKELSFSEYIGYVKKYHPLVRQSGLMLSKSEAELLTARGGFDPKIEVDYDQKDFKDKNYYSLLKSTFKIPTWYGIEIKAAFDNSEGLYVNPQNTTPNNGLTSIGISIPLGQGLFINKRMADVRMAKVQLQLSAAEQKMETTDVIYEASLAYFNWKRAFDEAELYKTYLEYAQKRYDGILRLIETGDKPAIDSVEAGILVKTRELSLKDAQLKLTKSRLELSNFLWIDNVPVELEENITPEENVRNSVDTSLNTNLQLNPSAALDSHPKIQSLQSKLSMLEIERRYKANMLLPEMNVSYNYLSEPAYFTDYRFQDYKIGLNFSFPLFLRKERGSLQLAKLKIQDGQLDLELERVALKNKILTYSAEIESLNQQQLTAAELVKDYTVMLSSEEKLFSFGESSLFLINSRENNVVSSRLAEINTENRLLASIANLYKVLSIP
ncbi:TolC family protein [Flavobacterium lindanitolerans]|uniref:Outer membrane protein TolC n=1 Tax=Flavobacterium lindanitolerans TaxID=428988 RepID=A0A497UA81_9FLAO|nr:TolC family protein [Flavobacterium lindanitolerans]PKW30308.1 outer membrane protein TolC [Flavobacterium lindanitolerans]RLJ24646.1 outer membrane protein TolC [Flavobacterium lindanitolerans]